MARALHALCNGLEDNVLHKLGKLGRWYLFQFISNIEHGNLGKPKSIPLTLSRCFHCLGYLFKSRKCCQYAISELKDSFTRCVFFVYDCDLLYVGLGKCSHGAICSACEAFLCEMSNMNGFHAHSVQLWCVNPICIYRDHIRTVWTISHVKKCSRIQKELYHVNKL